MKVSNDQVQNAILGAFAFTMGFVIFKIVTKYVGGGNGMLSKLTGNSNESIMVASQEVSEETGSASGSSGRCRRSPEACQSACEDFYNGNYDPNTKTCTDSDGNLITGGIFGESTSIMTRKFF